MVSKHPQREIGQLTLSEAETEAWLAQAECDLRAHPDLSCPRINMAKRMIERARTDLADGRMQSVSLLLVQIRDHLQAAAQDYVSNKYSRVRGAAAESAIVRVSDSGKQGVGNKYLNALQEVLANKPHLTLTRARGLVAQQFGVSAKTIQRHTIGYKKPGS